MHRYKIQACATRELARTGHGAPVCGTCGWGADYETESGEVVCTLHTACPCQACADARRDEAEYRLQQRDGEGDRT